MSARDKLRKAMEKRGWGPSKLAEEVGRAQPTISAFLTGRRDASADLAEALAKAVDFEVSPWELVSERLDPRKGRRKSGSRRAG